MSDDQNNDVKTFKHGDIATKSFDVLAISLNVQYKFFNSST